MGLGWCWSARAGLPRHDDPVLTLVQRDVPQEQGIQGRCVGSADVHLKFVYAQQCMGLVINYNNGILV